MYLSRGKVLEICFSKRVRTLYAIIQAQVPYCIACFCFSTIVICMFSFQSDTGKWKLILKRNGKLLDYFCQHSQSL